MSEPLPPEVEVPEGPPVSQDPAWVPIEGESAEFVIFDDPIRDPE